MTSGDSHLRHPRQFQTRRVRQKGYRFLTLHGMLGAPRGSYIVGYLEK